MSNEENLYEFYDDYEAISVGSYKYGEVIDGVQIVGPNEVLYSNGVRRLYDPDVGMFTFIKPDGAKALPGEEVETPDRSAPAVTESLEVRMGYLEDLLQDDSFWSSMMAADAEGTAVYREVLERQLNNIKELFK